jgi:hypothetical protein
MPLINPILPMMFAGEKFVVGGRFTSKICEDVASPKGAK